MKTHILDLWIEGKPVPFSTSHEKTWKAQLEASTPNATDVSSSDERGIMVYFYLKSEKNRGQPFDLDNFVEPVLSVVVNRKGYFQGKRSNIIWWYARRVISNSEGFKLLITGEMLPMAGIYLE